MGAHRHRGGGSVGVRVRVQRRASQRAALNRPDLTQHLDTADIPPTAQPFQPGDWPVIPPTHRGWWQVHRVVQVSPGLLDYELIAECQTESAAFRVSACQLHQVRITKHGDKRTPYFSFKPVKNLNGQA